MAQTYTPIASQTLGSAAASVTFSSIPGTYQDLRLVISAGTSGTDYLAIQYNGDTATNYSMTYLSGNGTAASSGRQTGMTYWQISALGTQTTTVGDSVITVDIENYAGTSTYKTGLSRANRASNGVDAIVGLWRSTAAINSILIKGTGFNLATGSTFTLFGIKAA